VLRTSETGHATRTNAATVKTVAGNLGAVAARIRGQVDHFLQALRAA
jgi:hypothetical protein